MAILFKNQSLVRDNEETIAFEELILPEKHTPVLIILHYSTTSQLEQILNHPSLKQHVAEAK